MTPRDLIQHRDPALRLTQAGQQVAGVDSGREMIGRELEGDQVMPQRFTVPAPTLQHDRQVVVGHRVSRFQLERQPELDLRALQPAFVVHRQPVVAAHQRGAG